MLLLPCCSLLSLLLYLTTLSSYCSNAEYITQPVSLNTSLNSTVTFTCEATDVSFIFFYVGIIPASENINFNRGFIELNQESINGTIRRRRLSVHAREINNNTYVYCIAIPGEVRSDNATLTIQGLLDSVFDLDYTFITGSSVLLTWTAPYTLDNVPITGYYILNGLVNITTTNNNTNITLSATNPDLCILNNVSVSPINDVGIGSSNNISFYYERVPLITPPVSVVPVIDGQQISLNISINVSELCKGEYPNSITVSILNTDNTVINNTSISTQVNDQLMIVTGSTSITNLNTFIVNVSLSNNGGTFNDMSSFTFGFLGPVTNIDSSIDNCSTIDITWTAPTVDDRVSILYYNLSIYDDLIDQFLRSVSVYDTSYQFVDDELFRHRYTYVITGVNELGEGISNNDTFSYQRVPTSVTEASSNIVTFNETSANVSFNIPVTLECTGEAPENVTITIQCGTVFFFLTTDPVEYPGGSAYLGSAHMPVNITRSVSGIPLYQQCAIIIVFSNEVGSSEPFILAFDTTPTMSPTPSPTDGTDRTITSSPDPIITRPAIIGAIVGIAVLIILMVIILTIVITVIVIKKRKNKKQTNECSAHASDRAYTSEPVTYSQVQDTDETTAIVDDDTAPMPYHTAPVEASSSAIPGGSEVMTKQLNKKQHQATNTGAAATTRGVATKEPIYSDLGVAPSTGTTLAKTEVASVNYADIESVRPKVPPVQSYDDVVVSAIGTTVIGPPPVPDKKSKGAATTGQETNGGTDAARNLPHHVNDDLHFSSAPPPSHHVPASVEGGREGGREGGASTVATYL